MKSKTTRLIAVMLVILSVALLLCSCKHEASCEVISEEFTDSINVNQVYQKWDGYRIVKLVITATFAEKFTCDSKDDEDFRKQISDKVEDGCSFIAGEQEYDTTYFYWAKTANGYKAENLTLFYVIPEAIKLEDTEFKLDGTVLGDSSYQFSYTP